ncbi:MAG: cadmium-translocating P-type ATPase [Negativicutes bacterium]|nr:cadmium-translocating P-type ATPase [Negativicutes bacterium]MBP8629109.1 cadmium-translocating P-type ATPase [Negativicutes bacterium]MBP9537949.1 cadmium-translocating P-type ATPase [Negativicutes bacterium]
MSEKEQEQIFLVSGICCADCAKNFESELNDIDTIKSADLNILTGKLKIDGQIELTELRKLGQKENYQIDYYNNQVLAVPKKYYHAKEFLVMVLAGTLLLLAIVFEKMQIGGQLSVGLYLLAIISGGWNNFKKGFYSLQQKKLNMSVLMSVAIIGACIIGQYEEGATVAFLYAISELLENWSTEKARQSIRNLMDLTPAKAIVKRGREMVELLVGDVNVGDIILIKPGAKIPLDGSVVSGESAVDEAHISGEALPRDKKIGADVFAGSINTYGFLEVAVNKLAQDSTIAKIINLVENAQSQKSPMQKFIEKFAEIYTPVVMVLAVMVGVIPPLLYDGDYIGWLYRALALLVVACPCALVISTPIAVVSAIAQAAKNGVLIKGGIHLEGLADINAIAFDKTGTITKGEPKVQNVISLSNIGENDILQIAASLESLSEHHLARAITADSKDKQINLENVYNFIAIPGQGVKGVIKGQEYLVGNTKLFNNISPEINQLEQQGYSVIIVGTATTILGVITISDYLKDNIKTVIKRFLQKNIAVSMLTGDNSAVATLVATESGIKEFFANLLPEEKMLVIKKMKESKKVAMVGDGINDAPALAIADIGIAMGKKGTAVALETADVVLMKDDIAKLDYVMELSKRTKNIIKQNITFALLIKFLAIISIFPGYLTLWLAILADMGATVIVTLNSMRLLKKT